MDILKIVGTNGKTMLCRDGKIKIIKSGGLFEAKREKIIPANNISGIEVKKPGSILNGYIQIQIAGQASGNSTGTMTGGLHDAISDENSVPFSGEANYQTAKQIQSHILDFNSAASNPVAVLSGADEILKYKQLMDSGIITQEEFEAKKKQILNG